MEEENNNSIGLRVQYGTFSVLLTGDSETKERQWWIAHSVSLMRDCTILKLAHHGSRNGTDQHWLDLVQPELAVASVGQNNDYGHPHSETLSLLRGNGVPLLRTDLRGTITIISNGRTWNVVNPVLARRKKSQSDADVASTSGNEKTSASPAATRAGTRRR
jgi:beta-lactamase superfamily II metal-dependent hydrolase